jgi:hypothetical protein
MTDSQYHAIQVKALRTGRNYVRSLDTLTNRLDRTISRLINNKKVIRSESYNALVTAWNAVKAQHSATEKALADAISSGNF